MDVGRLVARAARRYRDRVAFEGPEGQRTFGEPDLALRSAGLVRVALNHRLHPSDWGGIADDSGAAGLIFDARFLEETEALRSGFGERSVVVGQAQDGQSSAYRELVEESAPAPP